MQVLLESKQLTKEQLPPAYNLSGMHRVQEKKKKTTKNKNRSQV